MQPNSLSRSRLLGLHISLGACAAALVLPFCWMLMVGFGGNQDPGLHHLQRLAAERPVWSWLFNSLFVAGAATVIQVGVSAAAAFAFSRLVWPGRDLVFLAYLATIVVPPVVLLVPTFEIMVDLDLIDTHLALILPPAFTAYGTFLLRQHMLRIPPTLDEAALLDGAGPWQRFRDIALPLARPGIVTLAVITFVANYNAFLWPSATLRSEEQFTLPVGLAAVDAGAGGGLHLVMALVAVAVVPLILIFFLLQRYIVDDPSRSGS